MLPLITYLFELLTVTFILLPPLPLSKSKVSITFTFPVINPVDESEDEVFNLIFLSESTTNALFAVAVPSVIPSNLFNSEYFLLKKKINLGLDLQGGSYLLLEIDNSPVIEQKLQNLKISLRNYFKEKKIRLNNLKKLETNIVNIKVKVI